MSKHLVVQRQAENRLDIRVLIAGFGCLFAATAQCAEVISHNYYCPKYEAVLQFQHQRVLRSFGGEFPSGEFTSYTRTGTSSSHLADCSTSEMLCFEERSKSESSNPDRFVYAVPKKVKVGDTYERHGVTFRVDRFPEFEGLPPSVVIFAEGGDEGHRVRYKMHIEQERGITQLHLKSFTLLRPDQLH
jgi:hypothetical protein